MKAILWLLGTAFSIIFLFLVVAYFASHTSSTLFLILATIIFSPVIVAMLKNK